MKKYTKEERLEIGKEVYNKEIKINQAAIKYNINPYTVRDYMREYREINNLKEINRVINENNFTNLNKLSKENLIEELIKAKVEIEREKKGYQALGGGHKSKIKYETIN